MSTAPTSARSAAQAMTPTAPRTTWDDLPAPVRAAIEAETGAVRAVHAISAGLNSAITARLDTRTGPVFIKGVRSDRAAGQRREADLNPHVVPVAPRLHWQVDTDGWHVLGFEHIDARPARLSPGSADLPVVADTLARLGRMPPAPRACRRIEDRWADAAHAAKVDPALLAGDHLIHTDLNPHNILITQRGARVVDWAWPTLGAAWIDPACTTLWLIAEGHTPAVAEAWAAPVPSWTLASPQALDVFIATNAALWADIAAADPRPWKQRLHHAATMWAEQRRHSED